MEDEFSDTSDDEDWARLSGLNPISKILASNGGPGGGQDRKTFGGRSEGRPLMGEGGRKSRFKSSINLGGDGKAPVTIN